MSRLNGVTSELVDVVNLVTQLIWTDLRRSRRAIEPSQWATLRLIARGPCSIGELARCKAVSLPTMSKSVEMLARRGWVERVVDEADRRRAQVQLTAGGRRILADARRRIERMLAARLANVSRKEQEQLSAAFCRIREALAEAPSVATGPGASGDASAGPAVRQA